MVMTHKTTDVLVVGGGPAGLAAAIAMRQRGMRVTLADSLRPPIDKPCGEGLMPDSRAELARLGVEVNVSDGAPFSGIRFANRNRGRDDVATALFPDGDAVGVRRIQLHRMMVAAAERAGVNLRWQSTVQLKPEGRVLVAGEEMKYGWLVGADGQNSRVRKWAGLERGTILSRRFGFRQHFEVRPWSDFVEVHWGVRGQAYVTPVGPEEICLATITRDPHCRLGTIVEELPWLRARLRGVALRSSERGALTTTRRLHRVAAGRVLLLGDASGSADAITGEGMAMGFRQALLLAECLESGDVTRYNRRHPGILQLPQTMARVMLLMDRWPGFRDRAVSMLARDPDLFARMLGVHVGTESLPRFVAAKGARLAWGLLAQWGTAAGAQA